jgi:hypothetical protein
MRRHAIVSGRSGDVRRVMVYDAGDAGVYLFLYRTVEDGPSHADCWFETPAAAVECAESDYGIGPADWQSVPDPLPGCQHDWIAPVRVKRNAEGQPVWGQFEPFSDGSNRASQGAVFDESP